ncbi:MAG: hypothetical protein CL910_19270 [Deltaproteobacteria bacterium]|jgi:hypothetical protein|nr:hypothetical protein [Deltaproteobacteria bacterium]
MDPVPRALVLLATAVWLIGVPSSATGARIGKSEARDGASIAFNEVGGRLTLPSLRTGAKLETHELTPAVGAAVLGEPPAPVAWGGSSPAREFPGWRALAPVGSGRRLATLIPEPLPALVLDAWLLAIGGHLAIGELRSRSSRRRRSWWRRRRHRRRRTD